MKKIFIYAGGCELRKLDADKITKYLSTNNYEIVDDPKNADAIIFIACAFIDKITEYSLNKVKEFKKYDAELIVAGCLPEIERKRLSELFAGKTISTRDLDNLDQLFPEAEVSFSSIDDGNFLCENLWGADTNPMIIKTLRTIKWLQPKYFRFISYIFKNLNKEQSLLSSYLSKDPIYHVRISWGCFGNCSYCAIKKAIGPYKSKRLDRSIDEFRRGLKEGHKNFILLADDAGAYGLDIKINFPELLDKITNIQGDYRISIQNFNPNWLVRYVDDLEEILKRQKIKHIEVPIQSGSSRILKLMNRYPNTEKIKDALIKVKKYFPDLRLTTHYLVGFPSETEGELKQTLSYIRECNFDGGLLIPFSCKSDTKAEEIQPKISQFEISKRFRLARKILNKEGYRLINFPGLQCFRTFIKKQ